MGKELKIGLAVVSTLGITFCGVLYQRVSKLKQTPAVAANTKKDVAKSTEKSGLFSSSKNLDTVADDVASDSEAPAAIGSKFKWSTSSEEGSTEAPTAKVESPPSASYLPTDDAPAGDRYATRSAETEIAEEAPAIDETAEATTTDSTAPEASTIQIAEPPAATSDVAAAESAQPSAVTNPFARPSATESPAEEAAAPEVAATDEPAAPEAVAIEGPADAVATPEIEELAQDEDAPARLDEETRPAAAVGETRPSSRFITPQDDEPAAAPTSRYSSSQFPSSAAPAAAMPRRSTESTIVGGKHRLQPNENFWTVSEKAYGNGGYFKALHAYNAERFPVADELAVGDEIDVPSRTDLERQFPELCPKAGRRPASQSYAVQASAKLRANGNTYVVQEGDTLFDVARYELGKASRWAELYDLNREIIGDDIDYLRPGMELILPDEDQADALTRQPGSGLQR